MSVVSSTFWRWCASSQAAPLLSTNAAAPERVRRGWLFIYSVWIQPGLVAGLMMYGQKVFYRQLYTLNREPKRLDE